MDEVEHIVSSGDTLGGIAAIYFGDRKFARLLGPYNNIEINDPADIDDSTLIEAGQKLMIPDLYDLGSTETVVDGDREITVLKLAKNSNRPTVYRSVIFKEMAGTVEVEGHRTWWNPMPAKGRWIYVFGSSDGKKFRDVWEIRTDDEGKFATFELTESNYESRPTSEVFDDVIFLPATDKNKNPYKYYAAISEIRLSRGRIFDENNGILKNPEKRCVNIDDKTEAPHKIEDAGEKYIILPNHLGEARRRAEKFRTALDDYFQVRFDMQPTGVSDEQMKARRLKKYAAGLILDLIKSKHPHADRYRSALAKEGRLLEDYIRDEENCELRLRQKAEEAGHFLVTWMDDENGFFEEMLIDYSWDPAAVEPWEMIQEEYGNLLSRFRESSLTPSIYSPQMERPDFLDKQIPPQRRCLSGCTKDYACCSRTNNCAFGGGDKRG